VALPQRHASGGCCSRRSRWRGDVCYVGTRNPAGGTEPSLPEKGGEPSAERHLLPDYSLVKGYGRPVSEVERLLEERGIEIVSHVIEKDLDQRSVLLEIDVKSRSRDECNQLAERLSHLEGVTRIRLE